jgi:predicted GNAT family acetyltransferase
VLRTRTPVQILGEEDRVAALDFCAGDPPASVFVAARLVSGPISSRQDNLLAVRDDDGTLESMCWASANVVPLGLTPETAPHYADRLRRRRHRIASILGPTDQVRMLWAHLEPDWGRARAVRSRQPLMATRTPPSALGIRTDPRVRPARTGEVDLVLPAAEHMFTAEIGYAPYSGSPRSYRQSIEALVEAGQTYVVVEDGRVVFKADVGSVALDCCQIQGVWLAPDLRGRGLATPLMAAALEQILADHASHATLYVNDFNIPAIATYRACGMAEIGSFTTVLL